MKKLLLIPVLIGATAGTLFASSFETFRKGFSKVSKVGQAAQEAGRTKYAELKEKEATKREAAGETKKPESSFDVLARKAKLYGSTAVAGALGGSSRYEEIKAKAAQKKLAQEKTPTASEETPAASETKKTEEKS